MNLIHAELFIILALVLTLPFLVRRVEEELELFLFIVGVVSLSLTRQWSVSLAQEALIEPIKITAAVLLAGLIFRFLQKPVFKRICHFSRVMGIRWFVFLIIVVLGFISSVITAIIAALILVEIINCIKLDRQTEVKIVVLACFAIGLGAALTPIGEPLSTITIAKLKAAPYFADFFFLARQLGPQIAFGIIAFGIIGAFAVSPHHQNSQSLKEDKQERTRDIFLRSAKVYLFVMALVFLGAVFKPLIDAYICQIPYKGLFWLNSVSAILDNATLAAAEIGPGMQLLQIKAALLGLLIAGGMLIPGNIPNIISAGKLKIKSSEWAKFALPVGIAAMAVYFLVISSI